MPHAIDRLLATPMIRPRFPRIRPEASAIRPPPQLYRSPVRPLYGIGAFPHQEGAPCGPGRNRDRFPVFVLMTCNEAECLGHPGGRREECVGGFRQGVAASVPALRRYARA